MAVRVAGQAAPEVVLSRDELDGEVTPVLTVTAGDGFHQGSLGLLADQLVATRRVRADDLASDLAASTSDSVVRFLPAADRARLLEQLERGLQRSSGESGDFHLGCS